jgi:hypothetical protein
VPARGTDRDWLYNKFWQASYPASDLRKEFLMAKKDKDAGKKDKEKKKKKKEKKEEKK